MVDDGDVLIIDHFGSSDRIGLLGNVRVPGNSAFRDQVVQTVLNVKYGKSQSPSSVSSSPAAGGVSGQVVTPWLVPQSVPEPPQPAPTPTVPITLQQSHGGGFDNNLVTGRPQDKQEAVTSSLRPDDNFPVINNGDELLSKIIRTDSTPSGGHSIKFRPSPPDVYQTSRPSNAAQEGHSSAGISGFRPSKVISVTIGNQGSLQHNGVGGVTGPVVAPQGQQYNSGNNIYQNNIKNNFFKAQQAALLKASDRPQSLRHQSLDDGRNPQSSTGRAKQRLVPFLPGIPLPLLLQYGHRLSQAGRRPSPQVTSVPLQHHQRSGRENLPPVADDLQQQRPGSASLPTSIQDIINGDYDTVQTSYRAGGDPGIPATAGRQPTAAGGRDGGDKWLWRPS